MKFLITTLLCSVWGFVSAFLGFPVITHNPFSINWMNVLIVLVGSTIITVVMELVDNIVNDDNQKH